MAKQAHKPEEAQLDTGYQVVARRFRPHTFGEMVGQDEVLASLRAALQQHRIPHAFLFAGSRGVGKTTSARILARCLNCEQGPTPDPCGTCDLCVSMLEGSNPDVIEIDAASNNSVEDVRQLREHVGFATMRSRYRVVILDEVHMLSKGAFNALLKTLEEPPPGVVFVLATTEQHKVPETIRSRCQVMMFRRVGEPDLQKRLATIAAREGVTVAADVLADIAASVRGGVRDAETVLERILPLVREQGAAFDLAAYRTLVARVGVDAVVDMVEAMLGGDVRGALHFAREMQRQGIDEREVLGELVEGLRFVMLLAIDGPDSVLVPVSGALRERLQQLARRSNVQQLDAMIAAGLLGRERLRRFEDRGVVLEVALVRMAQAGTLPTVADLLAELRAGGGLVDVPGGAAGPLPAGAAPPPVTSGQDLKARVLECAKGQSLLHATLSLCDFAEPDAQGVVVVTVETERRMHRDRMGSPDVQRDLQQWVRAATGTAATVRVRCAEAAGGAAAAGKAPEPGPAAQRVMGRFGGRVVEVDPADRVRQGTPSAGAGDAAGAEHDEQDD
jgi:DNA polymerase-3 subunit gamma/tau